VTVLKFSRDRRGYEHFYIVQPETGRRGRSHPRILYWFRTPPNVRVGREPFGEDVRRRLEAQNPGVAFDWPRLLATPIPPPEPVEHWRERRRLARAARSIPESELITADEQTFVDPGIEESIADDAEESLPNSPGRSIDRTVEIDSASSPAVGDDEAAAGKDQRTRRRHRRRRRGRGPHQPAVPATDRPEASTAGKEGSGVQQIDASKTD
jgi:hypothetical protein